MLITIQQFVMVIICIAFQWHRESLEPYANQKWSNRNWNMSVEFEMQLLYTINLNKVES
jgi:hypothetical protein